MRGPGADRDLAKSKHAHYDTLRYRCIKLIYVIQVLFVLNRASLLFSISCWGIN